MTEMERILPNYDRDVDASQPLMCVMCGVAYEDDPEELVNHLKRHLDTGRGTHQCTECLIGFVHEADLERHLQSAAKGHCGFAFPHSYPCTGHHPPRASGSLFGLSHYDRMRLSDRLQHWEQAQLQAYMSKIDELTEIRRQRRVSRWSDVLRGGSRRNSQSSFAISVKTYASAPCDTTDGKYDVGGLQKRLQLMSLGNPGTRMRRLIRTGSINPHDTTNRSLQKAVKNADIQKAVQHLNVGADPSIIHEDDGPFITIALWGHGYVAERMAEHRVDEDIMGRCQKCKLNSSAFDKPAAKVKSLLRHGADPNHMGGLCLHPLTAAAWMGKPDIVKLLLDRGAEINQHTTKYGTALCAAAEHAGNSGHAKVVKILINAGADVHVRSAKGTALKLAQECLDSCLTQEERGFINDGGKSVANCQEVVTALQNAESTALDSFPALKKSLQARRSESAINVYGYYRL